jgi:hypothetical protein
MVGRLPLLRVDALPSLKLAEALALFLTWPWESAAGGSGPTNEAWLLVSDFAA